MHISQVVNCSPKTAMHQCCDPIDAFVFVGLLVKLLICK